MTHAPTALTRSAWSRWLPVALVAAAGWLGPATSQAPLRAAAPPAAPFVVEPAELKLDGNFARAQLVVTALDGSGKVHERSVDLTAKATYVVADPKLLRVDPSGSVLALANGQTTIAVTVAGASRTVPVTIQGIEPEARISFQLHVMPILSKASCNSAACHASQFGKGGFKLSVMGYAPDEDYAALVREREGRRANLLEPDKSLFLLKATLAVPHGGNRRIAKDSVDYQILRTWLATGAAPPKADAPKVTGLAVSPRERLGEQGYTQQLRVEATYADGTTRDVTHWARFDSMDEGLVTVGPSGVCRTLGRGQAPVLVRFEGQASVVLLGVPFSAEAKLVGWKDQNYIDTLAAAKFRELGIEPSPLCDDATFVRRAYLDAIGTLPTVEETRAFLESKDPAKRAKLIDRLLGLTGDPAQDIYLNQYSAYWAVKWADLIRSSSDNVGEQGMWALHNWIRESLRANKPYDAFVRELVMAKGSIYMSGPANYYRIAQNPPDLAETTSQLFLGVRLQCARCHHHPMEKYSQDDYYGFAAFFARVGTKNSIEFGLFGREQVVLTRSSGDVRHPKTNAVMKPTPLEGPPLADEPLDRREPLAAWLTSTDNDYFAKNLVNRYVGYLLGRGLVEPIDDLRATNPASNPALFDALARDFVESKYNLKHLLRTIMNSRLYQLDSQPTPQNAADERFYSHYRVKRIAAEPLLDAIDYATGVPTKYPNLPLGTRAIELPDSNYPNYFLATFGKPRRTSTCECERTSEENLAQALHTLNGDILAVKLADGTGRVSKLVKAKAPPAQAIEELYLATLSRRPTAAEVAAWEKLLPSAPSPQVFYEDLLWTLINSKQFLFVR